MSAPRPTNTSADPPRGCGPAWERPGARPAAARAFAALAVLALLAGCANLAPNYERPAAPVAAQFPAAAASAASTTPAAELDWQAFFGDERLKRLIALALQNNRDLRIAALNIEATRAQAQVRDADRWPTLNAGLTGSRQPTASGGINSLYTAGFQVTAYEIDLFGRLRSLSDAAAAQVLASEEARKAVQISLVSALAATHIALTADDELLRVTQQTVATREDSLRLIKLRFDNGASSELDLRQAESLLEAARVSLAQLTRQRALDENALVLLVGQPLPADLPAGSALEAATSLPELPVGLPSEVLTRRPDVRQAEQQLIAANANIGAARAAFFPRITLTGSAGLASGHLSDLFKSGSSAWSFAPQLLQPVFDAGRNEGNLQLAKANRDIAVAQYERAVQSAFREVADALAGRATLGEQLRAQQRQLEAERTRNRLAELRYRNGASSYLELLDAQRSLFAAQQALVQGQAQSAQNLATLYKVLGGGWR
ncbi:MAG TPA: efflux transporter outer membrane subunit [Piscinibacter sp.]|nr:efflux transporter outer membrane subunit [Piscinibacter sp.]MBP6541541.1 efflux transporter outer membrane subunit [Piscinibacter sp.]HOY33708.1 efflux transporter outer membrane subunit [Piscinibacter sp.]